jgi:membrane protease YdiL (CAAX protease family)
MSVTKLMDRVFPGMGWRPLVLALVTMLCLVIYVHHGGGRACPEWFMAWSRELWGIPFARFHQHGWRHVSAMVLLMILPLGVCAALGFRVMDLGLSVRHSRREFLLVLVLWAAFLPVVWLFSSTDSFVRTYPRLPQAEHDMMLFFLYEGFYLVKWVAWEFFFRGFLLFGFHRDMGSRAVLFSTVPFVLMHIGKPEAEVFASIAAGFILCWIALRSRSIWPGVLLHWLVATSMDFFASQWWR